MIFFETLFTALVATALGASFLHKEINVDHDVGVKGLGLDAGENVHQIAKFGNVEVSYEVPHAEHLHHHGEEGKHRSVVIHIEVDTSHDSEVEHHDEQQEVVHNGVGHGLKHHFQHLTEHPEENHREYQEDLNSNTGHGLKRHVQSLTEHPEEDPHHGEHQIHLEDEYYDPTHQPQSDVHHLQYWTFLNPHVSNYQDSKYGQRHLGGHQYQPNSLDLLTGYGTGVHHDTGVYQGSGYYGHIPQSWTNHEPGPHVLPHIGSYYGPSAHHILTHQQAQPWYTAHLGAVTPSEIYSTSEDVEVGHGYGQDTGDRQPFFGSGVLHAKHYGDVHH